MGYRDDIDALSARRDALETEVRDKTRELAETSQLLDEARDRARLPILDGIGVAAPCTADWNAMIGDDRVRHCGACDRDVYNLSGMSRGEAEALIASRVGPLCVRFYRRTDGTVLTADCPVGAECRRHRRLIIAAAGAATAVTHGALILWATLPADVEQLAPPPAATVPTPAIAEPPPPPHAEPKRHLEHTMGAMVMPPPGQVSALLKPQRIGGTTHLVPDEATRQAMAARHVATITATWKLCLDTAGKVTAVTKLKGSGFASYDRALEAAVRHWVYAPYEIDGRAVSVCTAATFVYRL
jgi:hypothetical protein